MSWGVIAGTERLIPQGGNNEMKLEAGKAKRFRPLLQPGEEPFSFFEHTGDAERFENGQKTTVFRTLPCPKTKANPYAPCKLCDGQQLKRRVRHTMNVWDHELGAVKILKGGDDIFKPIGTLVAMGIDVTTLDFVITRTGTGRNDTSYSVVSLGPSTAVLPADIQSQLFNMAVEYAPATEADMMAMVETLGMNWASVIVPPPLQYPASLQIALDHVIPNTKYKDQTMKQVWDTNKGMIEFFANSNRMTPEKAMAQVILVNLGGAQIEGVPRYNGSQPTGQISTGVQGNGAVNNAGNNTTGQSTAGGGQINGTTQPVDSGRQDKIKQINTLLQSNDKFVKGGYQMIMDTMKQASGGKTQINEFTDVELDKMLELCK